MKDINLDVQYYYGKELQKSSDLKTNACCTDEEYPRYIKDALSQISDEVQIKYYGCGLVIPSAMKNITVLDLGSGSGRDVYVASQLVGENGLVIGVDMTKEQLDTAINSIDLHRERFGYMTSNVKFIEGNIEELDSLGIEKESIDLIISNCVINLVENKSKVLKDVYSLLKPGGEMYFSDVYSDRRIPMELRRDKILWGECLSGALYWNDFLRIAKGAGFIDPRVVKSNPITVENEELQELTGDIKFHSVTYRLFKIEGLEDSCEDFGQAVRYLGSIEHFPFGMELDNHHYFSTGKIESVCGNTYKMLHDTRYKNHFEFYGDFSTHYGIFTGCGENAPFSENDSSSNLSASCC
ncbi:MAG: methyltransferase domain-containing protein [Melioribacteraceae bacterium]|nr:methyltransferase domain-containing protein [Melioribacteraceae bacterium]MCF8264489.1 methyltransferase domain-containing protein [Melioribacteraceae bacterium]MCF8411924.1 methyltransferase domain-containing protein [Melioribacteraceae bacterium]MCF8430941.1 methyltransferase domain-containing protein [Melioribacteraceae bacterium]